MQLVSQAFSQEIEKLYFLVLKTIFTFFEKIIKHFSSVGNSNILDNQQFDWVKLNEILKYREKLPNFQDIAILDDSRESIIAIQIG